MQYAVSVRLGDGLLLGRVAQLVQGDEPGVQAVLQVVDGVGDVVSPVHHLRFEAGPVSRRASPNPLEDRRVLGVGPVLAGWPAPATLVWPSRGRRADPRVLQRRVESRPGQVQAGTRHLGLEAGDQPKTLRVPFKAATVSRQLCQRRLAVVAEWRMTKVVREASRIDEVRVAAERRTEFAADLRAFQRVRQPGAREVARADGDDLRLCRQPSQGRTVQYPGAVPHERAAPGPASAMGTLGRLIRPPSHGLAVITSGHLLSLPPVVSMTAARPASRRATGTRNGEQDT